MTPKDVKRQQDAERQRRRRAARAAAGYVRREYYATPREHTVLATTLEKMRNET